MVVLTSSIHMIAPGEFFTDPLPVIVLPLREILEVSVVGGPKKLDNCSELLFQDGAAFFGAAPPDFGASIKDNSRSNSSRPLSVSGLGRLADVVFAGIGGIDIERPFSEIKL